MPDLFKEVLPSLNLKTHHMIDDGSMSENEFDSFISTKAYSFGDDIFLANMVNMMANNISKKMIYDFYFYGLDKKKRYNKWIKKHSINTIEEVRKYMGCSLKKAAMYAELLTEEQLNNIKEVNYRMEDRV